MNRQPVRNMPLGGRQAGRPVGTPVQLEYEELTKKMRITTAKLRIAEEGVDVQNMSQQNLDKIMRVFDDMEQTQRDVQQKTSKIQQESNIQIQKINQDASKKMMNIQKKYQDTIKSLKEGQIQEGQVQEGQIQEGQIQEGQIQEGQIQEGQIQEGQIVEAEPNIEEIREKTHEEKVSEITDIILREMRDSVYKRVDEVMKTIDTRAEVTIGRGVNASQEVIEELVDRTRQMTVESAIVGPDERPDDKDIPVITPEMMKKTEEEIAKNRGENKDSGRIE